MADYKKQNTNKPLAPAGVPAFALDHAPLLYLYSTDPYRPSSIADTLVHTRPSISFKNIADPSPPLTLSNLDQLNKVGQDNGSNVFLTSSEDVTTNPKWLKGNPTDDQGAAEKETAVIIMADKGGGVVDAFYFYYWAFNWGGVVLEKQLGDHVGDWEHNMIRFINGVPKFIWYSQHANGEAFTFDAVKKDSSGQRPLVYAANGSHALYPTPGTHDHTIPNLNLPFKLLLVDETDAGQLYDPLLSAYFYSYAASTLTFTPYNATDPVGYLYFKGHWGDQEYPADDKRQQDLLGNKKFVGGPTGPADKQLNRKQLWPESGYSKGQKIRTGLGGDLGVRECLRTLNCFGPRLVARKRIGNGAEQVRRVLVSGEVIA